MSDSYKTDEMSDKSMTYSEMSTEPSLFRF